MSNLKILQKIYEREFWPSYIFRLPIYFIGFYFWIKARHPRFFSAVNPDIWLWFMEESKSSVYNLLKNKNYPSSIIVSIPSTISNIHNEIISSKINFPVIIKPNWDSVRWDNVYKIINTEELKDKIKKIKKWEYLIQEFIDWEEYSIYYIKNPNDKKWKILWITKKEYPSISWDGKTNLWDLIKKHPRYKNYYKLFESDYGVDMSQIIENWKIKNISYIWNHSKWCLFLDYSHKISKELIDIFDSLFEDHININLHRADIKTDSRENILLWNFTIIEVNCGVFAEPTYIYDPDYKLVNAYKHFYMIWDHAYKISKYNNKIKKIPYISLKEWFKYAKLFILK